MTSELSKLIKAFKQSFDMKILDEIIAYLEEHYDDTTNRRRD